MAYRNQELLTDEQLKINQEFIDIVYEYSDSLQGGEIIDVKSLLKYLWNNGLRIEKLPNKEELSI